MATLNPDLRLAHKFHHISPKMLPPKRFLHFLRRLLLEGHQEIRVIGLPRHVQGRAALEPWEKCRKLCRKMTGTPISGWFLENPMDENWGYPYDLGNLGRRNEVKMLDNHEHLGKR